VNGIHRFVNAEIVNPPHPKGGSREERLPQIGGILVLQFGEGEAGLGELSLKRPRKDVNELIVNHEVVGQRSGSKESSFVFTQSPACCGS
jgi:hypothetical protein